MIFNFFVNRNWKKLADSQKRAKILADNCKYHHPIETLITDGTFITLGSSYYTCAFHTRDLTLFWIRQPHQYKPLIHLSTSLQKSETCSGMYFPSGTFTYNFLSLANRKRDGVEEPPILMQPSLSGHLRLLYVSCCRRPTARSWDDLTSFAKLVTYWKDCRETFPRVFVP